MTDEMHWKNKSLEIYSLKAICLSYDIVEFIETRMKIGYKNVTSSLANFPTGLIECDLLFNNSHL